MEKWNKYKEQIGLAAITILSALLSFVNLSLEGYSNQYYAAAVKSMTLSWKNFFFAALDPAGFVTIDKPPLGYWMQAISAGIFGFSGWSILVPQALAGVLSVVLIYFMVKKTFGGAAGLLSALFLAVTPVFVAVSRNNTVDNQVVFVLLLACWALMKATGEGKFRYLVLCMALIGIGFNIKMLQAYMILPAICAVYLFSNKVSVFKRVLHLISGTAVLLAVSLSWALIVDSISPDSRPYIGSSGNNKVMELIIGHNGTERLGFGNLLRLLGVNGNQGQPGQDGQRQLDWGGPGAGWSGGDGRVPLRGGDDGNMPGNNANDGWRKGSGDGGNGGFGRGFGRTDGTSPGGANPGGMNPDRDNPDGTIPGGTNPGWANPGGGPNGAGNGGLSGTFGNQTPAGITRLFLKNVLSDQIVWFIPLAFFGFLAAAIREKLRFKLDTGRKQAIALWFLWFLPEFLYFSYNTGLFHSYYLTMMAPPIAALAGIGTVALWKLYKEGGWKSWLLPLALFANGAVQLLMLSYFYQSVTISKGLTGLLIVFCFLSVVVLVALNLVRRRGAKIGTAFLALAVTGILVVPAVGSGAAMFVPVSSSFPGAGLELLSSGTGRNTPDGGGWNRGAGNFMQSGNIADLVKFLDNHKVNGKSQIVVSSANISESLTLNTDLHVGSLGGFIGNEKVMSLEQFKQRVKNGEIRYVLANGGFGMGNGRGGSGSEIMAWVMENGMPISYTSENSSDGSVTNGPGQLYDLADAVP